MESSYYSYISADPPLLQELKDVGFVLSLCLQQLKGELQSAALLTLVRVLLATLAQQQGEVLTHSYYSFIALLFI